MPPTDRTARLVEIRTYKLKPGHAERFVAAMASTLQMLSASGMDVVGFGRSDHEHESFCLIRAYADRAQLVAQQDAFYGSAAWRQGPRESLLDCLEDYLNTLLWLAPDTIEDLRSRNGFDGPQPG